MKYLKSKWSVWFHTYDASHDSKISSEDVDESAEKFAIIRNQLREKASSNWGVLRTLGRQGTRK